MKVTAIPKTMTPTTAQIRPTCAKTLRTPRSMRRGRGFFFAYLSGFFLYIGIPYFCSIRAISLEVILFFFFDLFLSILSFSDIYVPPWSAWLYSVLYYYTTNFRFFQVLSIINSMNNPLQADCGFIKSRARFAKSSVGSSVFFRSDSVFSRP